MTKDLTGDQKLALGHFKMISKVLLSSGAIALLTVLVRILGQVDINSTYFKAPVDYAWLYFAAASVAHAFWAFIAVQSLEQVRAETHAKALFDEVRTSESLFLRGLIPRTEPTSHGSWAVRMSYRDPTTWISCGLALTVFFAILPWRIEHGIHWDGSLKNTVTLAVTALVIVTANWLIGSVWAVALSQLALPHNEQQAFRMVVISDPIGPRWFFRLSCLSILAVLALAILISVLLA